MRAGVDRDRGCQKQTRTPASGPRRRRRAKRGRRSGGLAITSPTGPSGAEVAGRPETNVRCSVEAGVSPSSEGLPGARVHRDSGDSTGARVECRLQKLGRRAFLTARRTEPQGAGAMAGEVASRGGPMSDDGDRFAVGDKGARRARANVKGSACKSASAARQGDRTSGRRPGHGGAVLLNGRAARVEA